MRLRYVDADPRTFVTPLLAVGVTEGADPSAGLLAELDATLTGAVRRAFACGDMKGKSGDEIVLYAGADGPARVVLLGMGKAAKVDAEGVRRMAGRAVRTAERLRLDDLAIALDSVGGITPEAVAQAAAEGVGLAAWRFSELKADDPDDPTITVLNLKSV